MSSGRSRIMAWGFRCAWRRAAMATLPKCSRRVPNSCMWRWAHIPMMSTGRTRPHGTSSASWIASTAVSEMGRPMSLAKGRWPMPTIATRSWMRRKRSSPGSCTVIRLPRAFATAQMGPDLAREFGDRVEKPRALEHVVVVRAGDAQEALRLARRGEQALAEREGHDLVAIAVRDEDQDGERPDARE